MKIAKSATTWVAAVLKPQTNVACFGVVSSKKHARKPLEHSGIFQSEGRTATQLKALIHAIYLSEPAEALTVYCDSNVVDSFSSGTVGTWELADWCKGNGKPIENADLWQELSNLIEQRCITLLRPKSPKEMSVANKLMNLEKTKPELFINLNLGNLSDKYKVETAVSELTQEETDKIIATVLSATAKSRLVAQSNHAATQQVLSAIAPATAGNGGLTIDLDAKTLAECEALFGQLGLDTKTAVKMFLKQSLRSKSIPFDLKLN